MPISNYDGGFPNGITIRNVPVLDIQNGNGNVFWVDSNNGVDTNSGTFKYPFATLDYAIGRCTANQGDKIFVAAGHTESVTAAAGLVFDVAGITVYFMGEGSDRGTIDFGTAVSADMDIDAANVTLINPRFTASIDALTGPIDVNAANFAIVNGEYYDGTSIDTTDCIVCDANATGLIINGWKYIIGDEGGTQKQSNIQLNGVDNAILMNVDIFGDFATGNIENVTDEVLSIRLENIILKNTNATPKPGIVLDANATGQAKNLDIRIASGTTYVSSVAKLNWDVNCVGYNADGYTGDPIGTAGSGTIDGKLDAIQADIGDPSSRTNFQNLEDMIGIPDAANSSVDDILRTGFDSTAIGSNADGSIMEREEYIQTVVDTSDGKLDAIQTDLGNPSARTNFQSIEAMIGIPDSPLSSLDDIIVAGYDSSAVASDPDGSVMERQGYIMGVASKIDLNALATSPVSNSLASYIASGGTSLGTNLASNKSIIDAIGSNGTTLSYGSGSMLGAIGTTFTVKKTLVSSTIVQGGIDVTGVSSGGELRLKQVILKTDSTGLAGGTNVELKTDNARGNDYILEETVANLGANSTISLENASLTSLYTVIENGKKITINSTVADCTGSGEVDVYLVFERLAAGATISAA